MLTDIGEDECFSRFGFTPEDKIINDLTCIYEVYLDRRSKDPELPKDPFDLVVCSPKEVAYLKGSLPASYGFIVPGIRDEWMKKANEHQKRTTGVGEALESGATFVVMGAQMTKGNPESGVSPETSRALTLMEIKKVL
jgi:Orotidine-5''-phosphate decarboxylase